MQPYYQDDYIQLYNGDALAILPALSYDVFLTDPPYGLKGAVEKADYEGGWDDSPEYIENTVVPIVQMLIANSERGALTPGTRCTMLYPQPRDFGCFYSAAAATRGPFGFTTTGPILYYGNPSNKCRRSPSGYSGSETSQKNGHPCPKPLKAWNWLLNKIQGDDEIVVDPFCGSGTTLRVAKDQTRKAIGIEIEERYCEIIAIQLSQEVLAF